jgi:hypothetical protein
MWFINIKSAVWGAKNALKKVSSFVTIGKTRLNIIIIIIIIIMNHHDDDTSLYLLLHKNACL